MKKRSISIILLIVLCSSLSACCISHDWQDASCEEPKTCAKCGKTEGDPLQHTWVEATCTQPKICSICGKTEGSALDHDAAPATCTEDSVCSRCSETVAKATGHEWADATARKPKTCKKCGLTRGKPLGYAYFTMDSYEFIDAYNQSAHALGTLTKDCSTMKIIGTQYEIILFVMDALDGPNNVYFEIPEKNFNEMMIRFVNKKSDTYDTDYLTFFVLIAQSFAEVFDPTFDGAEFVSESSGSTIGNRITMSYSHNGFDFLLEGHPYGTGNSKWYFYDFTISLTANNY